VEQTDDDALYQSYREGPLLELDLPLGPGLYDVTLHFAEPTWDAPGMRRIDVWAEGALVLAGLDLAAQSGIHAAHAETFRVAVHDATLDLALAATVHTAVVSAVEVCGVAELVASPAEVAFGIVALGQSVSVEVVLSNPGVVPAKLASLAFAGGDSTDFVAHLGGLAYAGAAGAVAYALDLSIAPGAAASLVLALEPQEYKQHALTLRLDGLHTALELPVSATAGHAGHALLHCRAPDLRHGVVATIGSLEVEPEVRSRVEGGVLVDECTERTERASGSGAGEAVEAHGEGLGGFVRQEIGRGFEDGLQELAGLVFVPLEDRLDETS
jgi:hypothetical protein